MPVRIVTTHLEFEGQVYEQRVVLEGDEPPVWGPDAELSVVGNRDAARGWARACQRRGDLQP